MTIIRDKIIYTWSHSMRLRYIEKPQLLKTWGPLTF